MCFAEVACKMKAVILLSCIALGLANECSIGDIEIMERYSQVLWNQGNAVASRIAIGKTIFT